MTSASASTVATASHLVPDCLLGVRFAPGDAGLRTATLKFSANTAAGTHAVSLSGRGVTPVPPGGLGGGAFPPAKIDVKLSYGFKTQQDGHVVPEAPGQGRALWLDHHRDLRQGLREEEVRQAQRQRHRVDPPDRRQEAHRGRPRDHRRRRPQGQIAAVKTIKIRKKDEPAGHHALPAAGREEVRSCAVGVRLEGAAAGEDRGDGLEQDREIQPDRPALEIEEVEPHEVVEVELRAARDLPQAGQPRAARGSASCATPRAGRSRAAGAGAGRRATSGRAAR